MRNQLRLAEWVDGEAAQVLQSTFTSRVSRSPTRKGPVPDRTAATTGNSKRAPRPLNKNTLVSRSIPAPRCAGRFMHLRTILSGDQSEGNCSNENRVKGQKGPTAKSSSPISTGSNFREVTQDIRIVAAALLVPGRLALYYTSYSLDIRHLYPDLLLEPQCLRAVWRFQHQPGGFA